MLNLKVAGLMLTGVMALGGIGYGVSQTPAVAAAIETPAGTITQTLVHFGGLNFGSERPGFLDQETMDKAIADALGMTVEELQAARDEGQTLTQIAAAQGVDMADVEAAIQAAKEAAVAEAVANGDITQEQADRILSAPERFGGPGFDAPFGFGGPRGGHGQFLTPEQTEVAVADALGMTVEELQAARDEGQTLAEIAAAQDVDMADVQAAVQAATEAAVAEAVANGDITQEQADRILSEGVGCKGDMGDGLGAVLPQIFDREAEQAAIADALGLTVEALQAAKDAGTTITDLAAEQSVDLADIQAAVEAARTEAVQAAVDAGTITQEQADAILSHPAGLGGPGFGGGRGHHGGMRGGMPGFRFGPGSQDNGTDTGNTIFTFPTQNG